MHHAMTKGKKSPGQRLGAVLESYFKESSIHGLSYLSVGHRPRGFVLQACFWLSALAAAYGLAISIVHRSWRETDEFPIISTVDSISITDVPFPAVTVNAGDAANPWGTVEKLFNFVDFECYDSPHDCPPDKRAPLEDVSMVTQAVTQRFFDVWMSNDNRTVEELEELQEKLPLTKYPAFPELKEGVSLLSLIMEKKKSRSIAIRKKLARATADIFARFTVRKFQSSFGWGSKYLYPIILEEAGWLNMSKDDAKNCKQDKNACPKTYAEALSLLLLPSLFNSALRWNGTRGLPIILLQQSPVCRLEELQKHLPIP